MLAPHAALRSRVTAGAGQTMIEAPPQASPASPAAPRRRAASGWARLIARIYQTRPLACSRCQGEMRLIAFLTEPPTIRAILWHLGEPTTPPPLAPRARAPPEFDSAGESTRDFDFDPSPPWDPIAAPPDPGISFDQTVL